MNWIAEYKTSLKKVEAEEFLDIYFFRPFAFIIVKALYSFPITPNQYSLMAFISGIFSGVYFFNQNYFLGAFFFFLFAVLDCCDGMQARMKKNGTPLGRVIDGLVDWSINAFVYLALVFGAIYEGQYILALLFFFSGITKAINSGVYDNQLMEYLSFSVGKTNFTENEIQTVKIELTKTNKPLEIFAWRAYLFLLSQQLKNKKTNNVILPKTIPPELYLKYNLTSLKMWSLIGPAVHIAIFILAFLIHTPELLFIYCALFGVGWHLYMSRYQIKINQLIQNQLT